MLVTTGDLCCCGVLPPLRWDIMCLQRLYMFEKLFNLPLLLFTSVCVYVRMCVRGSECLCLCVVHQSIHIRGHSVVHDMVQ